MFYNMQFKSIQIKSINGKYWLKIKFEKKNLKLIEFGMIVFNIVLDGHWSFISIYLTVN